MTRFAGRVSAANYITAGNNAASQSSDMAEIARANAPKYEKLTKQLHGEISQEISRDCTNNKKTSI